MTWENRIAINDIDKSGWPENVSEEPDKVQWVDEETGLDCLIVRNTGLGHLCGYVGLPPGHPSHGKDYDDIRVGDDADFPDVHGGLTFSDKCHEGGRVCHVPEEGRPADVWWLGFDCAHSGDLSPAPFGSSFHRIQDGVYRNIYYVRRVTESLARQLRD